MQEISLNEYIDLDKKISAPRTKISFEKKVKIAILGSFTLNGFKEALNVKCHDAGIRASFYINDYGQYVNELTDRKSGFYRFKPDVTFLLIDARSLFGELYSSPYQASRKARMEAVRYNHRKLRSLIENFIKYGSGILVMNNFEVPVHSPMGILEAKEGFGYLDMFRGLNARISGFNKHRSFFVFDYDSFASGIGKENVTDHKLLYLADMKISPDAIPALCEEYMRYVKALLGLTRKCIVLDLDNTLWGGIVGEDGFEGIKLGPTPPGNAYMEFQKYILALFHRGVILAVNSNNNRTDVIRVLRRHPYMVLKERHFASLKINWENKVKNLAEIAKDINIGLNSIIYLDDDARNRQVVREALPEVHCPDLPRDASGYTGFLARLKGLDALHITREDRSRGRLYETERKRKESLGAFRDLSKYLEHLKIAVEIKAADKFSIPRLAQLTLRTNQFNFSTKRCSEKEMAVLASDKRYDVYCARVTDKYGDSGITGAAIILKEKGEWFIDTFLMSCRILGRDIEEAFLSAIVKKAIDMKIDRVAIGYVRSEKNQPVLRFLKRNGLLKESQKVKKAVIMLYEKRKRQVFAPHVRHVKVILK